MEPLLTILAGWWWVAPAATAAGATGYGVLTSGRRRARRLELDAARHEQQTAYRALVLARADVRAAQAQVLSAKSRGDRPAPGEPSVWEARRMLQSAKQAARAAQLALRASRGRVRATAERHRVAGPGAPLPIDALIDTHDALTARWLEYETDAGTALTYPQMLDAQHPATLAFLRAQHEALRLRPTAARTKVKPAEYVAYRDAVRAAEAAFAAAEADARRSAQRATPPWPRPRRAEAEPPASRRPEPSAPVNAASPSSASAASPGGAPAAEPAPAPGQHRPPRPAVWPVPSRTSKRPD